MWETEQEKNSLTAVSRAFSLGFGIETDIRDRNGELVISHNPADESAAKLEEVLKLWRQSENHPMMALNIKADGLYLILGDVLEQYGAGAKDYFLFDASIPEQYVYLKRGYHIFTRSSEFEPEPAFLEQSDGVWLDQFTDCGHIEAVLPELLAEGKMVVVVSPELHGRAHDKLWQYLYPFRNRENLALCTDMPKEAGRYLGCTG